MPRVSRAATSRWNWGSGSRKPWQKAGKRTQNMLISSNPLHLAGVHDALPRYDTSARLNTHPEGCLPTLDLRKPPSARPARPANRATRDNLEHLLPTSQQKKDKEDKRANHPPRG